jgi:hypothetical protein
MFKMTLLIRKTINYQPENHLEMVNNWNAFLSRVNVDKIRYNFLDYFI